MKNRKGNVAIVVLVLGVFIICTLALFSFFVSNFDVENSFTGVSKVEDLSAKIELNSFNGDRVEGLNRESKSGFFSGNERIFFVKYGS